MKVIFLDRDGVINKYPGAANFVTCWEEFHFLPNIKRPLKKLKDRGFKIFIISNQSGVARGLYSKETLNLITKNMLTDLNKQKIGIEGVFYCTHLPGDNCFCRKPKPGLIKMAARQMKQNGWNFTPSESYFIGDSIGDIGTGKTAGLKTILIFSGKEKLANKDNWQHYPDFTAKNLSEAVKIILKNSQ